MLSRSFLRSSCAIVSVLVLVGCAATAQESPSELPTDAAGFVQNWIDAVGGMENYTRMQTATFTLTTEMWDAESGRLRRTRPRYVWIKRDADGQHARVERWEGDNFIAHGWNPSGQWAAMNDSTLTAGDKDYDEANYVGGDVNYWIGLPYKLMDPGVNLELEGKNDDGFNVVRVWFGEGIGEHDEDVWRYYFEDNKAWPTVVEYTEGGRTSKNSHWWKDIQQADGYFFAGRRVYFDGEERVTKVIRMSDLVVNPELDPALFTAP